MIINYFKMADNPRRFIQIGTGGYIYECTGQITSDPVSNEDLTVIAIIIDSPHDLDRYCDNEFVKVIPYTEFICVHQDDGTNMQCYGDWYIKINDFRFAKVDYCTLLAITNQFEFFHSVEKESLIQAICPSVINPITTKTMKNINVNIGLFPDGLIGGGVLNLDVRGRKTKDYYVRSRYLWSLINNIMCDPRTFAKVTLRGDMIRTKLETSKQFRKKYSDKIKEGSVEKIRFKRIRNDIIGIEFGDYLDIFPAEAMEIVKVLPHSIVDIEKFEDE